MARPAFVLVRSRRGRVHRRASHPRRPRVDAMAERRSLKRQIWKACHRRCVYCAQALDLSDMTLDHVIPRALGGHSHADNLAASCRGCNIRKGCESPAAFFQRDPLAGLNFLRFAHAVPRHVKRAARRAVSLGFAEPRAA